VKTRQFQKVKETNPTNRNLPQFALLITGNTANI